MQLAEWWIANTTRAAKVHTYSRRLWLGIPFQPQEAAREGAQAGGDSLVRPYMVGLSAALQG